MDAAHFHLMLTHVPVLGVIFGGCLFAFALWRGSDDLKRAALGVLVIAALVAVPTYLSGKPAEDRVESLAGGSKAVAEQHEETALIAFIGMSVLAFVAIVGLVAFRRGRVMPAWYASVVVAAAVAISGLMAWTANLGGQIRHSEIRADANLSAPASQHQDDD